MQFAVVGIVAIAYSPVFLSLGKHFESQYFGKFTGPSKVLTRSNANIGSAQFDKSGQFLFIGNSLGEIQCWDTKSGLCSSTIQTPDYSFHQHDISVSSDGNLIVGIVSRSRLGAWNKATGRVLVFDYSRPYGEPIVSAISPNNALIATGDTDDSATLWNTKTGRCQKLGGHRSTVLSVAFSLDGKTLATGSRDNSIRTWNASSATEIKQFNECPGNVTSLAFVDNDRMILGSCIKRTSGTNEVISSVFLKQLSDGKDVVFLQGWHHPTLALDARHLAGISEDGDSVMIWDLILNQNVFSCTLPPGKKFVGIGFSGTRLNMAIQEHPGLSLRTIVMLPSTTRK